MEASHMKIEPHEITVRELIAGFRDNGEDGVWGYGGKLNIRPPYQREFVYKEKDKKAVIESIMKGFPLNVMYWSVNGDGTYEIIDGQQRTMSICEYCTTNQSFGFKIDNIERGFQNLSEERKNTILDYKLMIYFCDGTSDEKRDWFQIINTAGVQLTNQELLNAIFSGSWVTDAKRYFSKRNCMAADVGKKYMTGRVDRQEYLETAIKWISNGRVEQYMKEHQHDVNANELVRHFKQVIAWVELLFPEKYYRAEMKGVDWGKLFNACGNKPFDAEALERDVARLMQDEEIESGSRKGIYPYVLTRDERYLNLRAFPDSIKRLVYERQQGVCAKCGDKFPIEQMEGDHVTPWSEGGRTTVDNCQMLCKTCNRRKSNK